MIKTTKAREERKDLIRTRVRDTRGNPPCDLIIERMLDAEDYYRNLAKSNKT